MEMMVRDIPEEQRPRERLLRSGAGALSDAELLAILLRTGTRTQSVLHLAEEVLAVYKDMGLYSLTKLSPQEFSSIKGIGEAKAATVLAAVELGKRFYMRKAFREIAVINGPDDVAAYAVPQLRYENREHFAVLLLDVKNKVIAFKVISIGTLSASLVHPREVFAEAVRHSAAAVILVHNHPSGDPSPSSEDISLTKRLQQAGRIMDIRVLDHVIIGGDAYCSLKEKGFME